MSTSSPLKRRFIFAVVLAAGVLSWQMPAWASSEYPGILASELDMECPPPCTICHRDQSGGRGTATREFAKSMINVGELAGESDDTVKPSLAALEAAGTDSDADGVGDVDELRASTDPNMPGNPSICGPTYGCGARVAAPKRTDSTLVLFVLSALVLVAGWQRLLRR